MSDDAATADEITDKELSLLLLSQLAPSSGYDNVPIAIEISGQLRWWPLQQAVNGLLRRHAALRTVFSATGDTFRKTVLPPSEIEVEVEMRSGSASLAELVSRPFTVDGQPLIRVGLVRDGAGDTLCVTAHHLVFDGPSAYIALSELMAMYEHLCRYDSLPPELTAPVPRLPEVPPSEESTAYWRRQLDGAPLGSARMPFTRREPDSGQLAGAVIDRPLPEDVRTATDSLRQELRVTDNIVYMAAFYALLTRHGAGTDLVIGVPVNMRDAKHSGSVGYHANTIALRAVVDRDHGFRTLAHRVRETVLTGLAHADVTVDSIGTLRGSSAVRSSPFRYLFNYLPVLVEGSLSVDGMPARAVNAANQFSRYDLELFVMVGQSGSRLRAIYNTSVHTPVEVEQLMDRYLTLIRSAAAQPDAPIATLRLEPNRANAFVVDEAGQRLPTGVWGRLPAPDSASGAIARVGWDGRVEVAEPPATPSIHSGHPGPTPPSAAPADDTHLDMVLAMWREVLKQPDLDPDTDFFAAGGQSLVAVRLLQRTGRKVGFRVSLDTLTSAPTPRSFAARLATLQQEVSAGPAR